jgi:hypothetical protein
MALKALSLEAMAGSIGQVSQLLQPTSCIRWKLRWIGCYGPD